MAELVDAYDLGSYLVRGEGSSPFSPTIKTMKVTIENKKGLNKSIKVFIDKKTISTYMNDKYNEVGKSVVFSSFHIFFSSLLLAHP